MAAVIQKRIRKMMGDNSFTSQVVLVPGGTTSQGQYVDIVFVLDGGGTTITAGVKTDLRIDFRCVVTSWTLLLDQSATIRVDVWRDSYGNYPPVAGDSMPGAAGDRPQTVAAAKGSGSATAWDFTTIVAGDTLRLNVDLNDAATRATLVLKARRV
jgi:hypothetical protein